MSPLLRVLKSHLCRFCNANPWCQWSSLPRKCNHHKNIHNHHHHLSNNWTGANFYDWMPLLFHQLRISRRTNSIPGDFHYFQEELKITGDFSISRISRSWRHPGESESQLSQHNDSIVPHQCHDIVLLISLRWHCRSSSHNSGPSCDIIYTVNSINVTLMFVA